MSDITASTWWGSKNRYSNDEQIVGEWIDGKPIYQKTIDCGALSNKSTKTVAHNIANIDKIVYIDGFTVEGNSTFPLPYVHDLDATLNINLAINKTNISILNRGRDCSGFVAWVTIQYTKTTD